jgi:hypothetical protein
VSNEPGTDPPPPAWRRETTIRLAGAAVVVLLIVIGFVASRDSGKASYSPGTTLDYPDPTDPPEAEPPATDPPRTCCTEPDPPPTDPPATDPPPTDPPAAHPPRTDPPRLRGLVPAELVGVWVGGPGSSQNYRFVFSADGRYRWTHRIGTAESGIANVSASRMVLQPTGGAAKTFAWRLLEVPPVVVSLEVITPSGEHQSYVPA